MFELDSSLRSEWQAWCIKIPLSSTSPFKKGEQFYLLDKGGGPQSGGGFDYFSIEKVKHNAKIKVRFIISFEK